MGKHARFEKRVADAKKNITEISPQDAAAKLKSVEAIIVDVRDKDEWDEGHIPGALHMSRGTIEPAKNGLQKRPLHGRRLQSVESRRAADDQITGLSGGCNRHRPASGSVVFAARDR